MLDVRLNTQKKTKFCGVCGIILSESNNSLKNVSEYRFYLTNQIRFGKRTFLELFLDTKLIYSGLLKYGVNISTEVDRGNNIHLVEIKIIKKNFHFDAGVKDYSQKINFELVSGNILEFELKNPFIGDCYFILKP